MHWLIRRQVTVFLVLSIILGTCGTALAEFSLDDPVLLYEGDNCQFRAREYGYAYQDGMHYLVWSNGGKSSSQFWTSHDGYVKLSTSEDGRNWQTENIAYSSLGSSNHYLAVDDAGNVHIVYNEQTSMRYPPWGFDGTDLVYLNNSSGRWEKTVLESDGGYRSHTPSGLFFTEDGILHLFYNKNGWWRYNAPLYERKFDGFIWSRKELVSNINYGPNDPDDFENKLLAWEIEDGRTNLYLSSGFYHQRYHAPVVYSNDIFRLTEEPGETTGYTAEKLPFEYPFFAYDRGSFIFVSQDYTALSTEEGTFFSLDEGKFINQLSYDKENGVIVANAMGNGVRSVYIFKDFHLQETIPDALGCVRDGMIIVRRNYENPKQLLLYPLQEKVVKADVDIDPDTLNLKSKGRWITAYIELPQDNTVEDILLPTLKIETVNGEEPVSPIFSEGPSEIWDYDGDGLAALMVKFDRQDLIQVLTKGKVLIDISAELLDGTRVKGGDTIRVK